MGKYNFLSEKPRIAVIGAGWYGIHIALKLCKSNLLVSIFEKNTDAFSGISGEFGIRLHAGPHYPRSEKTRESCHEGFEQFKRCYPELINDHLYSIYGLGTKDSDNQPSKVNEDQFLKVAHEFGNAHVIKPDQWGYHDLITAIDINEPSIVLGDELRNFFKKHLKNKNIQLVCGFEVTNIKRRHANKLLITGKKESKFYHKTFSHVINTTSYKTLLPIHPEMPLKINVVYQVCLALAYEDKERPLYNKPISFIVMDGWFPCLMPYDDGSEGQYIVNSKTKEKKYYPSSKYIMTHGKHTIIGSFKSYEEAQNVLSKIDNEFINQKVKLSCEQEMQRFWPHFKDRFSYSTWKGTILAKLKTDKEFRSAITFQDRSSKIIYIFPGKVSNIFDAEREVSALIGIENKTIITEGHFQYVKGGTLDSACNEVIEKPKELDRNTCGLEINRYALFNTFSDFNKNQPDASINSSCSPASN